jgi:hypothetical protein
LDLSATFNHLLHPLIASPFDEAALMSLLT